MCYYIDDNTHGATDIVAAYKSPMKSTIINTSITLNQQNVGTIIIVYLYEEGSHKTKIYR